MAITINDLDLANYMDLPTENLVEEQVKTGGTRDMVLSPQPHKSPTKTCNLTIRFLPRLGITKDMKFDDLLVSSPTYYLEKPDRTEGWNFSTFDKNCPLRKLYYKLDKSENPIDRANAKHLKIKNNYYALVYVVNDSEVPANNGKYMFYKFGTKIYNLLKGVCAPSEADIKSGVVPNNFWDLRNGCNFVVNGSIVGDFPSFDASKFIRESVFTTADAKSKLNITTDAQMANDFKANWIAMSNHYDNFLPKQWDADTYTRAENLLYSIMVSVLLCNVPLICSQKRLQLSELQAIRM
jgi:hypothetical protein